MRKNIIVKQVGLKLLVGILFYTNLTYAQSLPLPYYTGFDSTSEQAGWQEFRLGVLSSNNWGYAGANACSDPLAIYHDYNVSGMATDTVEDWFVSPPLNLSTPAKLTFKISSTMFGTQLGVWLGTGDKNPANGNFTELAHFDLPSVWQPCIDTFVQITTLADTGYLAFWYVGSNFNAFGVDDIMLTPDSANYINGKDDVRNIEVVILPNPLKTTATLSVIGAIPSSDPIEIRVYDLWGQVIIRSSINHDRNIQLSRGALASALYFVEVIQAGKVLDIKKLLVD